MATCDTGILNGIFELVRLAGGLSGNNFTASASISAPRCSVTAIATSSSEIFFFGYKEGKTTYKIIPWSSEDNHKPSALAFSPTAEWLLVACEDGSLFVVPTSKLFGETSKQDHRFSTTDVVAWPANGSRAKPAAVVWWQTMAGDASLAVIGTDLGELCFIELVSGKEVGGTYITVPVTELFICRDNSLDTVYLLISGTEDRQWRLVLEQKSSHYLFPLENISSDWGEEDGGSHSQDATASPTPRSRLKGLKQLSVEKLQLLKQRLADAKHSARRKPHTENKGVDTCDIDEVSSLPTITLTDQESKSPGHQPPLQQVETGSACSGLDGEISSHNSSRPERLNKYIYDVVASPQYAKERYLLAGHYKPNSCLMVYSTDLETTPLFVFKLPEDAGKIVLHDELIFCTRKLSPSKVTVISTFFSASTNINGEIDSKINPVLQDISLPEGEDVMQMFAAPPFIFGKGEEGTDSENEDLDSEYEVQLPSRSRPNGCLILSKTSLYLCQVRKCIESLFMELTLQSGDIEAANKLGVVFSLDPKLFEVAADAKLQNRSFAAAITLYKHSRCPHVKCSVKFAWAGYVPEFITYMNTLTSGPGGPDLGIEQRRHLANLAVIAHLHQLSMPAGVRTPSQQQSTLRNLLLLLRHSLYYDELFVLSLAATTWRWETLQYVASSRGLLLEKLHALLRLRLSPIMSTLSQGKDEIVNGINGLHMDSFPMCRERESGFLHCISDPELRGILLFKPNLARDHMTFVLSNLNSLEIPFLRRLVSLYDPMHPALQPFLALASYLRKSPPYTGSTQQPYILPSAADDPIELDMLTQIFLAVLIKLNQRRKWSYNPEHLVLRPLDENTKREPFLESLLNKNSLSCGYGHSGVIIAHTLYTWGQGDYGILGHGPRASTSDKVLDGLDTTLFRDLEHLSSNGNGNGNALFNSTPKYANQTDIDGECLDPKPVTYLSNMKIYSIASGKNHMLAITDYGVYGWGSTRFGQVGNGSTGRHSRPVLISSLVNLEVIHVACGQFHSLCVTRSGKLYTWGWGVHGQLGHGSVEDNLRPTLVKALINKRIIQAEGGYAHSVALSDKGAVYAWGCSTYGQVGTGGIVKVTLPTKVPLPLPVTHLASGYFHNIVVTNDHRVFTWGSNPACLRVQAQIQKHNRSAQHLRDKQEEKTEQGNCDDCEEVKEEEKDGDTKASPLEGSNQSAEESLSIPSKTDEEEKQPESSATNESEVSDKEVSPEESPPTNAGSPLNGKSNGTHPSKNGLKLISANTVPSCDPLELGHLLPKEVDMPFGYGAAKAVAGGSQHSLLLTTHGALYAWGRNMSGQLGTGNRRELSTPCRILDDVCITNIASGSDFNLAFESHGQLWAWGSNYYSQLGKGSGPNEEKGQSSKVFMLRTTKRVLKVPQSLQSNVETPRIVAGLPPPLPRVANLQQNQSNNSNRITDLNSKRRFNGSSLSTIEGHITEGQEKPVAEEEDDGAYGTLTLHFALNILYPHYSAKNIINVLNEAGAHQALATLYTLERQYSKAMHHQLCSLLRQSPEVDARLLNKGKELEETPSNQNGIECTTEESSQNRDSTKAGLGSLETYSSTHVNEAVRIMDHYLRLQTEESQSGMRGVLQEGIGLWLSHSLPLPQLEDLLLNHLPRTVYPLALLLFGEENPALIQGEDFEDSSALELEEATAKVLSRLSTKFCLNLCSSVISHLQAGECNTEQLETLSQLAKPNIESATKESRSSLTMEGDEPSNHSAFIDTLSRNASHAITLSPEQVSDLKKEALEERLSADQSTEHSKAREGAKAKGTKEKKEQDDKDCVLFTCGHNFTLKDFKDRVLPQLEKTVTTVPGLLGKTARVLLDQYHSDQPQMACPHCVLAHLTIKLTKHNHPS